MNKQELLHKHSLVNSKEWKDIRQYLFTEIEEKAATDIEPLKLQGLLLAVKIIDTWEKKYIAASKEFEKE